MKESLIEDFSSFANPIYVFPPHPAKRKPGRPRTKPLSTSPKRRPGRPPKAPPIEPPIPRPFDFGFTTMRPLVPMPAVTMFLNRASAEVLALIEDGRLRWAFDIRAARASRREVRVLRQSLFEFTGLHSPPAEDATASAEFLAVIDRVLPAGTTPSPSVLPIRTVATKPPLPREPILRAAQLAQCFSCTFQHILHLTNEKSLHAAAPGNNSNASLRVTRASVIEFLKQRRMS